MKTLLLPLLLLLWVAPPARACSLFAGSDAGEVLVGNNEDDPPDAEYLEAQLTFSPAQGEARYGKLYFHFPRVMADFPQGGLNTAGLMFDFLSLPPLEGDVQYPDGTPDYPGGPAALVQHLLDSSATVTEAVALLSKYRLPGLEGAQMFVADKRGDAVIVGVGPDHRVAFTRKKGKFLLATNFSPAFPERGGLPEKRYELASKYWGEHPEVTLKNFRTLLASIHYEMDSATIYSSLYDLKRGTTYLYWFHNYADVVKLDLRRELRKGPRTVAVSSLFPVPEEFAMKQTADIRAIIKKLQQNQCKP